MSRLVSLVGAMTVAAVVAVGGILAMGGASDGTDNGRRESASADDGLGGDGNVVTDPASGNGNVSTDPSGGFAICLAGAEDCQDVIVSDCVDATIDCQDVIVSDPGDGMNMCLAGAEDCQDTPSSPPDDACIMIYPAPPECGSSDEPVSSEPPPVGGGDPDLNACDTTTNADGCQVQATDNSVLDLARRLQIEPETITVVSAEFVEWPDACLGISSPGIACAEVITHGFKVILEAAGQSYEYHTDANGNVALVE